MGKPTLHERAEKLGLELSKCGGSRIVTDPDTHRLYRYALTPKGYAVNNDQSTGFYTISEPASNRGASELTYPNPLKGATKMATYPDLDTEISGYTVRIMFDFASAIFPGAHDTFESAAARARKISKALREAGEQGRPCVHFCGERPAGFPKNGVILS